MLKCVESFIRYKLGSRFVISGVMVIQELKVRQEFYFLLLPPEKMVTSRRKILTVSM